MKKIPLHNKQNEELCALVDDADYDLVVQHRWHLLPNNRSRYASAWIDGKRVYLHRFLMSEEIAAWPGDYPVCDHINHDGLDCTRANLRVTSQAVNIRRRRINTTSRSGYRGVTATRRGTFIAQIRFNYKQTYIGTYATAKEAFAAWLERAKELFGADGLPELKELMAANVDAA